MTTLEYRFKLRRGTAAQWTASDEVLLASEFGHETDTNKVKIGNGADAWSALPYFNADDVPETDGRKWLTSDNLFAFLSPGSNITLTQNPTTGVITFTGSGGGGGEILVADGFSSPPVMLTNEAEDDFLYTG